MSQPKQYKDGELDPLAKPIASIDDLVAFLDGAKRPRASFLIGVEHEKFGYVLSSQKPLPYLGEPGVESFLRQMAQSTASPSGKPWEPVLERGHVVALSAQGASVTLEPGGQIELSGAPFKTIHEVDEELKRYEESTDLLAKKMGIGFLTMGYHPQARREDIPWVPKERYAVMRAYMPKVGSRGVDMMLRTCTVQANLDYESEADMAMTFRTALALSPFTTALFATSPFAEGKPSGLLSERTAVWQDTDRVRCGFPQVGLEADFGFERWVQFALDVPMYFIRREGGYVDMSGASFRAFMKEGFQGHQSTVRDFADHLTTLFTEVRIKPQIEMRSADCGPASHLRALPAFWVGTLYDSHARELAWQLMEEPSAKELHQLQLDMARMGLRATYRGKSVLPMVARALEIAALGLERLANLNAANEDERKYLKPLFGMLERGQTLAEAMLQHVKAAEPGDWMTDVERFLALHR